MDYRKLNAVTIAQLWPVQRIDGLLGSKLFTSLDLDAFTSQRDAELAAFTQDGHYQYKVMLRMRQ